MEALQDKDYNKKLDFGVWKKVLLYCLPYKKYLIALTLQMIIVAAVDAVFPMLNKYAIDTYITGGTYDGFIGFCIIVFLVVALQAINIKVMILFAGKLETYIPYDIRTQGFRKLQELSLSFYDKTPVGWLMARMTSDVRKLSMTLSWNIVDLVWSVSMMTIMATIMLVLDWKLALLVLATVPLLVLVSIYFQKLILKNNRKVRKMNSHIINSFNEGIMGAKTIKTLVREEQSLSEFKVQTEDMKRYAIKTAAVTSVYTPLVMLIGSIGTAAILWKGGINTIGGFMSIGSFVAFMNYAARFFDPVQQFARIFSELQSAQAAAERIVTLLETEVEIKDSADVRQPLEEMKGGVRFEKVSFAYKDGEKVLEDFNLEVRPGETIALVGETGAGKTTIVNLTCRFYEPVSGRILIDGGDYKEKPMSWIHSNLGYVLQEPHLFSGSVRDNIAYNRMDASLEEIERAAKLVNAHEFIVKLENGYETDVGERGSRLSTGQKQLISFARAILVNPGIFVLDEATSSVDTETEHLIQDAIQNILKGRTSFIIAHRLSTIRSADRILVIEKGRVIEEGTHKELLTRRGYYYRLYT
ncbi:MAG: ABC transporter ATP-binding protein, partial [Clostridiales bacterium]|nr:ABC transporter ATP-binding protein [Clostridiales bacterium]